MVDESNDVQAVIDETPAAEVEAVESNQEPEQAEAATASEENHDKKHNGIQKRINELTADKYDLKGALSAKDARIAELESQMNSDGPAPVQQSADIVPPNPDLQYDNPEKYQQEMIEFNRNIARSEFNKQTEAANAARQQQESQERVRQVQTDFVGKAEKLGINAEDAFQAAQLLVSRGMSENLGEVLVHHDKSPAIMDYLGKNPAIFEEINGIAQTNPIGAAQKLMEIESQAIVRNISSAPEPAPTLSGLSAREPDEFEKLCPGAEFK